MTLTPRNTYFPKHKKDISIEEVIDFLRDFTDENGSKGQSLLEGIDDTRTMLAKLTHSCTDKERTEIQTTFVDLQAMQDLIHNIFFITSNLKSPLQ